MSNLYVASDSGPYLESYRRFEVSLTLLLLLTIQGILKNAPLPIYFISQQTFVQNDLKVYGLGILKIRRLSNKIYYCF